MPGNARLQKDFWQPGDSLEKMDPWLSVLAPRNRTGWWNLTLTWLYQKFYSI
jgi:hypothetical protein